MKRFVIIFLLLSYIYPQSVKADDSDGPSEISLGDEYTEYAKSKQGGQGKHGNHRQNASSEDPSIFYQIVVYLPNRVRDLVDVLDELGDFALGFFTIDYKKDDLH
jgi:hypothetical protein